MLSRDNEKSRITWLEWIVYLILAVTVAIVGINTSQILDLKTNFPREYVRLERYLADNKADVDEKSRLYRAIDKTNDKLERLANLWAQVVAIDAAKRTKIVNRDEP